MRSAIFVAFAVAAAPAAADTAETCLPRVGQLVPLAEPLIAQIGVLDLTFDVDRHDAEFRGCELDAGRTCELSLHRRVKRGDGWITPPFEERGFGEAVTVPRDALETTVRLPLCVEPAPPPIERKRRPTRRRAPKPKPKTTPPPPKAPIFDPAPDPEAVARARVLGAPGVQALIAGAFDPDARFSGTVAVPPSTFTVPEPGERLRIGPRVEVEVGADGAVTFHQSTVSVGVETPEQVAPPAGTGHRSNAQRMMALSMLPAPSATARGEGLNAFDGVDIDGPLKRAYVEATREARYAMYVEHRRQEMSLALFRLEDQLVGIRDSGASATEQAAAVFAAWSEARNETEEALEARHATAGAEARAHVEGFVRRAWDAPPAAFGRAALVRLHRAHGWVPGQPVFDPYAVGVAAALGGDHGRPAVSVDAGVGR